MNFVGLRKLFELHVVDERGVRWNEADLDTAVSERRGNDDESLATDLHAAHRVTEAPHLYSQRRRLVGRGGEYLTVLEHADVTPDHHGVAVRQRRARADDRVAVER